MIYISSSCSKENNIKHAIEELIEYGFRNIELSGGTKYYPGYENDVMKLKTQYSLNLLVHNYFPPPKEEFVLNLASQDNKIYHESLEHLRKAIQFTKKIGAAQFGFHAGFFVDISVNEIGRAIDKKKVFDRERSLKRFCSGYRELKKEAQNIKIYIENNVYSRSNFCRYGLITPLMLTTSKEYSKLKERINFNLLLDVAHLYVSARSLSIGFDEELKKLLPLSDYIHLSDNDGYHDQNLPFGDNSEIFNLLQSYHLKDKIITLEIYSGVNELKKSYERISSIITE